MDIRKVERRIIDVRRPSMGVIRKAPFEEVDGVIQPTEDTMPDIRMKWEIGLKLIDEMLDNQDMKYGEKITKLTEELNKLKSDQSSAFFLKRPFYNGKIKELERKILQLNNFIQQRDLRQTSERQYLSWDLKNEEVVNFINEGYRQLDQTLNDVLVSLGKEGGEGTSFQQSNV